MEDALNPEKYWPKILSVAKAAQASSLHFTIASVDSDGTPTATPIGTVFFRTDGTGYYFDSYTNALARNLATNPRICLMAVNSSRWFWFKALVLGRFSSLPGIRLYGTAGPLRPANQEELAAVHQRIRGTRWLRGNRLLWSNFTHVRDLEFSSFRPVIYPVMMGEHCQGVDTEGFTQVDANL